MAEGNKDTNAYCLKTLSTFSEKNKQTTKLHVSGLSSEQNIAVISRDDKAISEGTRDKFDGVTKTRQHQKIKRASENEAKKNIVREIRIKRSMGTETLAPVQIREEISDQEMSRGGQRNRRKERRAKRKQRK